MVNGLVTAGLFLLSGIVDTLCAQQLVYLGMTNMRSMASLFAYYFSSALIGLSPISFGSKTSESAATDVEEAESLIHNEPEKKESDLDSPSLPISLNTAYVLTALCDFSGYIVRTIGLSYCGSGLFQVAFSSVAIWSALYSRVFLKTPISCVQWIGIAVVTLGLAISPLSSLSASDSPLTGILLTLVGAQFYALSYVINEYIMSVPGNKGSREICKRIGIINTMISLVIIAVDTYPHREALVLSPLREKKASFGDLIQSFFFYVGSHFVHSWALFSVQGLLGAVWTGLLQCIRACAVFLVSGYLYCGSDANQCLTLSKGLATVFVCTGIVIFNYGKK